VALVNNICGLFEHKSVFQGPLASLRERTLLNVAITAREEYQRLYPRCHLEPDLVRYASEASKRAIEPKGWRQLWDQCLQTANPTALRECWPGPRQAATEPVLCIGKECGPVPQGAITSEAIIGRLEQRLNDFVVDKRGWVWPVGDISPAGCPRFRDEREDRH